jgi:hypothetical protein
MRNENAFRLSIRDDNDALCEKIIALLPLEIIEMIADVASQFSTVRRIGVKDNSYLDNMRILKGRDIDDNSRLGCYGQLFSRCWSIKQHHDVSEYCIDECEGENCECDNECFACGIAKPFTKFDQVKERCEIYLFEMRYSRPIDILRVKNKTRSEYLFPYRTIENKN